MKTTEISKNTFWGIWCALTIENKPRTTCGLAWHMIFTILSLPFWVFPGIIVNAAIKIFSKYHDAINYYVYIVANAVILFVGVIHFVGGDEKGVDLNSIGLFNIYWMGLLVSVVLILFIAVSVLIIFGFVEGWKYILSKIRFPVNRETTISSMYYSLKDKHCSRIFWK